VQLQKCVESVLPVLWLHFLMVTEVFYSLFSPRVLILPIAGPLVVLAMKRKLHLCAFMDLIVSLKDDVVVQLGVGDVIRNPLLLNGLPFLQVVLSTFLQELLRAQTEQEVAIVDEAA